MWHNITSKLHHPEVQKYGIHNMDSTNRCSRVTGEVQRADQEELDREELRLVSLLHKVSLIVGGGVHFSLTSKNWTRRSRRVRSYPMSGKMRPSGVTDKHTCIDKSESKSIYRKPCREHRHTHKSSQWGIK